MAARSRGSSRPGRRALSSCSRKVDWSRLSTRAISSTSGHLRLWSRASRWAPRSWRSFVRTSDRYAYLDTSAFVKLCWPEPESETLHGYLRSWPLRVSAALLWTEALRAAQRQSAPRIERTVRLLQRVPVIEVD